jgi:hypothetical protein
VHDRVKPSGGENGLQVRGVGEICDYETRAGRNGPAMSAAEIIEYRNSVTGGNEVRSDYASDIPGSAGDQDVQEILPSAFSTTRQEVSSMGKEGDMKVPGSPRAAQRGSPQSFANLCSTGI